MIRRLSILFFISLMGCQACRDNTPYVAKIGDYKITQKDRDYRDKIIRVYYPETAESYGLRQLVGSYTNAQVLKNNDQKLDDEILKKEEERINQNTRAPETLERIKQIFGDDVESYRKVFILPTYADRVIYFEYFMNNPEIHAPSLKAAQEFLAEANQNPSQFKTLAEKKAKRFTRFEISLHRGMVWEKTETDRPGPKGPKKIAPLPAEVSPEGKKWIDEVIRQLKPGQVHGQVIDKTEYWLVAKYVGLKSGRLEPTHQFEAAILPKQDFGKWFEAEKAKIKFDLPDDPSLKQ
jgi:hypothetical protein